MNQPRNAAPAPVVSSSARADRRGPPLKFPPKLRDELTALARRGYPQEVCGLLVGRETGVGTAVKRITSAANLEQDRVGDRYTLDPRDYLRADADAQRDGLEIVGVWHTHPDQPARPSTTDLKFAWDNYTYLILSVPRKGLIEIRAWALDGDSFVERPIEEVRQ